MKIDKDTNEYKDDPVYKMGMLRVLRVLLNEITFCNKEITPDMLIEFEKNDGAYTTISIKNIYI